MQQCLFVIFIKGQLEISQGWVRWKHSTLNNTTLIEADINPPNNYIIAYIFTVCIEILLLSDL